jgi:hypothetical protein
MDLLVGEERNEEMRRLKRIIPSCSFPINSVDREVLDSHCFKVVLNLNLMFFQLMRNGFFLDKDPAFNQWVSDILTNKFLFLN